MLPAWSWQCAVHHAAAHSGRASDVFDLGDGRVLRLLHLDLHPDNVILSPAGPVVIDWTNAHRGDPALDVALTWVILATSGGRAGRIFLRSFLRHVDRDAVARALPAAAAYRLADPNVGDVERRAVRRLVSRAALPPP